MSDELAEISAELRRHLAWQEADGSKLIWKDPNVAAPVSVVVAKASPVIAAVPKIEVFGVQLLSSVELNPELTGDLRFVDAENGMTLDVSSVGDLLGFYHEHLNGLQEHLSTLCRQRSGRFTCLDAATPIDTIMFDVLKRKGWVQ